MVWLFYTIWRSASVRCFSRPNRVILKVYLLEWRDHQRFRKSQIQGTATGFVSAVTEWLHSIELKNIYWVTMGYSQLKTLAVSVLVCRWTDLGFGERKQVSLCFHPLRGSVMSIGLHSHSVSCASLCSMADALVRGKRLDLHVPSDHSPFGAFPPPQASITPGSVPFLY